MSTAQDYQAVVAFAQANNLTVTYAHSNRVILDVTGKVADIQRVLHVNMLVYQHPTEPRTFYAPDVEPSLDLTVPIQGIEGLNNYALPHPNCMGIPLGNEENPIPNAGSGHNGTYAGNDFRAAYLPGVTLNGAGQTVGLLEFDGYTNTDIIFYETNLYHPPLNVLLTNVLIDGAGGPPGANQLEVTLDIDMAIAMAPGLSEIIVYEAPLNIGSAHWWDLLNRMADDISPSNFPFRGTCIVQRSHFRGNIRADGGAGESMFVSSGDYDAYQIGNDSISGRLSACNRGWGNRTDYNRSGKTLFSSEAVWDFNVAIGCTNYQDFGSGGGISTQYEIPYWQSGVSMSATRGPNDAKPA